MWLHSIWVNSLEDSKSSETRTRYPNTGLHGYSEYEMQQVNLGFVIWDLTWSSNVWTNLQYELNKIMWISFYGVFEYIEC